MASSIPRERTIEALREEWASIADLLDRISDDEWSKPTPLPGWDVHDNVAHIIGTESMLAGEPAPEQEADREASPHVRNDIGVFNEGWIDSLRGKTPDEMRSLFAELTTTRLAALDAITQEAWDEVTFTPAGQDTHGRFMQIRVMDCWMHEQDIRDAVGRPGNAVGLPCEVMLDEVETALGFVVGKKAGVAPGQSVTFALTDDGAVVREIHVAVAERAAVVESLPGPATTTLTMPIGVMTRRCAGRVAPEDLREEISIAGDADIAERVLSNQAYTL
ncbi:MAG: maleylpyruvate isomerase family mycothiol-dependent enzyme [Acidimicrobiia bacterium]|nr:maleylpyruvate isomerase family mycothiol-dependent enzyme [Acidimicrobiia bacterium]